MSARDVAIDTLTFEDLLRIALEDLPGASQGEWTLHGPIDPGVTMLELFAAQFEQRLFMADQLTEPMVRASLRLLGVPDPAAATAATTVLSVTGPPAGAPLPAGTVFGLDADVRGREFALDHELWVLPVTGARASGRLLTAGDALELELLSDVAAGGGGAALEPELLSEVASAAAGGGGGGAGELSLLVEVAAAPGVAPAWTSAAVDVAPPAQLRWSAHGPDGSSAVVAVDDTTGALRRSGIVRVAWPGVWDRPGSEPRRLRATAISASYTEPVRVVAVHANAAVAHHRVARSADVSDQLRGILPLPGQRLRVPGAAGLLCDGDGDVVLTIAERDGERHEWRGVRTFVGCGPADRVVLVDRARGELRFGDGRRGRIARPADVPDVRLSYVLGAGRDGNLGPACGWSQAGGAAVALNPVAAQGGDEPEPLDGARRRAADALSARDRTVTEADARGLAESTPGIGLARAHVVAGLHPAFPCADVPGALAVTIVPWAARDENPATWTPAPQPDGGALAATRERLGHARLLGQEISVLAPVYRSVTVAVTVSATARSRDAGERIRDALARYLDVLVGGSEGDGWPFGGPVRPSALVGIVQRAIGPEARVTRLAAALDGGAPSDCAELAIGRRELVFLAGATIDQVAALPTGGGLR